MASTIFDLIVVSVGLCFLVFVLGILTVLLKWLFKQLFKQGDSE